MRYGKTRRFARNQSGVAAIEMALIFPVLVLLFFGMIDLTGVLSDNRKLSYAATIVADNLTRDDTTTRAQIQETFAAAAIAMSAARASPVRIEVHNYWLDNGIVERRWQHTNGIGTDCVDPNRSGLASLMTDKNDVLIAVICANHAPIVTSIIGKKILGKDKFTLRQQFHMRPRQSLTLLCSDC